MQTPQEYYQHDGPMTALAAHAAEFRALPRDLAPLCEVVQGVSDSSRHRALALRPHPHRSAARRRPHPGPMAQMLSRIHALDARPLTDARDVVSSPAQRMPPFLAHAAPDPAPTRECPRVRDAASARTSRPASSRTIGSASIGTPPRSAGSWWTRSSTRSSAKPSILTSIRPTPRATSSSSPATPWQMCRTWRRRPRRIRPHPYPPEGLWFVAGNILRDLASLNKMEMLPWDVGERWRWATRRSTDEKKALLDRVAALTLAGDDAFAAMRAAYESDDPARAAGSLQRPRNAPENVAS